MKAKHLSVLGDSIAHGYLDNCGGWFGRMQKIVAAESVQSYEFFNMAQDGACIHDVYRCLSSEMSECEIDVLLIAVGVNDIGRPYEPDAEYVIPECSWEEYWRKVLELAQKAVKKVIVVGVLPVRENCYPFQDWSDIPIYVYNHDIVVYNELLARLCSRFGIVFYNPYFPWAMRPLDNLYLDACHPNEQGHELLADEIGNFVRELL